MAGGGVEQAAATIEQALRDALPERQQAILGTESFGLRGKGPATSRRTIAQRIAAAHNALRAAVLDGGVLAFSAEGRAVQPLPADDQFGLGIDRLPYPVAEQDVTADEVEAWLAEHREQQEQAYEQREAERLERAARAEIRKGETDRHYGMVTGAANCGSCGAFKSKHSSICTLCGDVPGTHNGDPRDVDIAHGRAA